MELGGNDFMIVFVDVDINKVVCFVVVSSFENVG